MLGGLYLSSEIGAGSGSAIAFFAALLFAIVAISKSTANLFAQKLYEGIKLSNETSEIGRAHV